MSISMTMPATGAASPEAPRAEQPAETSVFSRARTLLRSHRDYVADGYRRDCDLGNRMMGGMDAPLLRQFFGCAGKVVVVAIGGVARATGLAYLVNGAKQLLTAFVQWVGSKCLAGTRFVGGIVAEQVVDMTARQSVGTALRSVVGEVRVRASDPDTPFAEQQAAAVAKAYLEGRVGEKAAEVITEIRESPKVLEAISDTAQKAADHARPYTYAGAAVGIAGVAAALYSGQAQEIASAVIVGGTAAAVGAAGYYYVSSTANTVWNRFTDVIWPTPGDDEMLSPQP